MTPKEQKKLLEQEVIYLRKALAEIANLTHTDNALHDLIDAENRARLALQSPSILRKKRQGETYGQ